VPTQLAKGAVVDIKQSGRQFSPRHAVVQAGTKVNFPNLDSMYHNVFSKTPGSVFDLGIYRAGDPTRSYTRTNPGVVDVFCDMHADMSASVLVVPSKLYVAADDEGRFTLENVPRGSRKLVAWAPGFAPSMATVVVSGKEATLDFTLKPKSAAHTKKDGLPYGSYK
jgi:plastocyanin